MPAVARPPSRPRWRRRPRQAAVFGFPSGASEEVLELRGKENRVMLRDELVRIVSGGGALAD